MKTLFDEPAKPLPVMTLAEFCEHSGWTPHVGCQGDGCPLPAETQCERCGRHFCAECVQPGEDTWVCGECAP